MSSNAHYRNESKNMKLAKNLFKISQEPTKRIEIKEKKTGSPKPKLSDDEVREIRRLHSKEGFTIKQLAEKFCIHITTCRGIINYEMRGKVL